ncbi:TetR/AcrR family transcriptional regulator [Mycolicibacterium hippocampi]|nr:TetR/AcrR family transcriptional regulator [Mycolicibacterium hippocampi]
MSRPRADPAESPDARTRIVDAVRDLAELTGLRKLSMDEVARRAKVGRATLYTYFPGRDALLAAAVAEDLARLTDAVTRAASDYEDADERLVHGFAQAYRSLRQHGPLSAILRINPEILLPFVITDSRDTLDMGSALIDTSLGLHDLDETSRAALSEHVTRLLHTLMLVPRTSLGLEDRDGPERYARAFLVPVRRHLSTHPYRPKRS